MKIELPLHYNEDILEKARELSKIGLEATAYTLLDERNKRLLKFKQKGDL